MCYERYKNNFLNQLLFFSIIGTESDCARQIDFSKTNYLISRSQVVKVHSLHQFVIFYVCVQIQIITCIQMQGDSKVWDNCYAKEALISLPYEKFKCTRVRRALYIPQRNACGKQNRPSRNHFCCPQGPTRFTLRQAH